jgi:hypothetical protein
MERYQLRPVAITIPSFKTTLQLSLHVVQSLYTFHNPPHIFMRLSQAALVAILAATVASKPIMARTEDAKAMDEYKQCCDVRDKHEPMKVCTPPKKEDPKPEPKPEMPKPQPKPEAPKPHPEAPKPEAPKPEAPKPEAPKPEALKPHPAPPAEHKPAPAPAPVPAPEKEEKYDEYKVYTFGEEVSLKCEGGKIVVKGKAY